MKKKILILGAGYLQVPGILKAKEIGYHVLVVDKNKDSIGFKYADQGFCISTTDTDAIIEVAKEYNINGIMTLASDRPVNVVARVSKELGISFMSPEDALIATNKDAMRIRLMEKGIPIPKFQIVHTLDEYCKAISQFGSEFIVKPSDNSGGRGIFLVHDLDNAEDAYKYSFSKSESGIVLIEEYMRGKEVSVEAITVCGKTEIIAITDKLTTGEPYFVEVGHTVPSDLSKEIKDKIEEITLRTIEAVGIINGPSHTEIKITDEGPKIVEIGARLGGGNITSDLVPLATGVDMLALCIQLAMGEEVSIERKTGEQFASLRYKTCDAGIISRIGDLKEVENFNSIRKIEILKNIGDTVNLLKSCEDRVAFAIATGNTAEESIRNAEIACSKIQIEVDNEIIENIISRRTNS